MRKVERRLRERLKDVEAERDRYQEDRRKFREHFASRFRWWIELHGKSSSPSLPWLIEQDAKFLKDVEWWGW